jgi:hypothetical protein
MLVSIDVESCGQFRRHEIDPESVRALKEASWARACERIQGISGKGNGRRMGALYARVCNDAGVEKKQKSQFVKMQEMIRSNEQRLARTRAAIGSVDAHLQQVDRPPEKTAK